MTQMRRLCLQSLQNDRYAGNVRSIMLALVDGVPKVLTLKEILQQYIDFQRNVIQEEHALTLKRRRTERIFWKVLQRL